MSDNPEAIQWKEPSLDFDVKTDMMHLNLGVVELPPHINPDNTERILAIVTELVNQMIEDDILPGILCPEDDSFTPMVEGVAFEDGLRENEEY